MDLNPKVSQVEGKLFSKILPLQGKHIFTKSLGDGEINRVTRKNDLSGVNVCFHSNAHGEIKLDGVEFLEEVEDVREIRD